MNLGWGRQQQRVDACKEARCVCFDYCRNSRFGKTDNKTQKKTNKKNLYGQCGLFFRFSGRTIGTAGDDMPTVCDVQSTTRVDLERDYNRASWQ